MLGIEIRMAVHTTIRALAGTYMGGTVIVSDEGERTYISHTIAFRIIGARVVRHGKLPWLRGTDCALRGVYALTYVVAIIIPAVVLKFVSVKFTPEPPSAFVG